MIELLTPSEGMLTEVGRDRGMVSPWPALGRALEDEGEAEEEGEDEPEAPGGDVGSVDEDDFDELADDDFPWPACPPSQTAAGGGIRVSCWERP